MVDIYLFAYLATESTAGFLPISPASAHQVSTWLFQLCRCFPHSDTAKGVFVFLFLFSPEKEKGNKEVNCQEEEGSSLVLQMVPGGPLDGDTAKYRGMMLPWVVLSLIFCKGK